MVEILNPEARIEAYKHHANFTSFDIKGDLLFIGSAADAIDLQPIVPYLPQVDSIYMVGDQYHPSLKQSAEQILNTHQYNGQLVIKQRTPFQSVEGVFNNIIFFGADPGFVGHGHYRQITKMLKVSGMFYGTYDKRDSAKPFINQNGFTFKDFPNIERHPDYQWINWHGLTIKRNKNIFLSWFT